MHSGKGHLILDGAIDGLDRSLQGDEARSKVCGGRS
jgi:hypothetical protein